LAAPDRLCDKKPRRAGLKWNTDNL
jgi:hypothetical protein